MQRSDRLVITPTALATWRFCPQKWRYRYQQRLRQPTESSRFAIGTLQHVGLEALSRGASDADAAAAIEAARQGKRWDTTPTPEQAREAVSGALEVWRLVARLWPGAEVEERESEVYADHPDDPTIRVGGIPDILLRDRAGRRVLLDYKRRGRLNYSRPVDEIAPEDLFGAVRTLRDVQSTIYCLALAEAGRPVDEAFLVKSTAGGSRVQIMRTTPTPESLASAREALRGVAEAMRAPAAEADRAYPADGSCYSYGQPCEYSALCGAEVAGQPTEELRARFPARPPRA